MKLKNSTKKMLLALTIGLGIASTAAMAVKSYPDVQLTDHYAYNGKNPAAAQVQLVMDSSTDSEDANSKYSGCGLSCAGCAAKCF